MSNINIEVRRYIIKRGIVVEITNCFWCGSADHICTACAEKAERAAKAAEEKKP